MGKIFSAGLVVTGRYKDILCDIRKKFFTMVVKHWHRLTREAEEAPSLETLKATDRHRAPLVLSFLW